MIVATDDGVAVTLTEASQVGEARRRAAAFADRGHFTDVVAGRLALVVTELGSNLVKHGAGGSLILRATAGGIEILALDRGPGMADVERCIGDGFSTSGTPGTGLGAVRRQSALFDVCSVVGVGTAILAVVASDGGRASEPRTLFEVGAVAVPKPGEDRCGDRWAVVEHDRGVSVLVVDGLGHGPYAADAADAAVAAFIEDAPLLPAAMVEKLHRALRATRGVAAMVLEIDPFRANVRACGVGNVCATILSDSAPRHLVSHNGVLGRDARRISEFTYPWPERATLVLHSDGIATRWDLDRYPGLQARHPSLAAGVIYRDFSRGRDDAVVVVGRLRESRR